LSISLPKSEFGMSRVDYLGHTVSAAGIEAKPKNLDELVKLQFPRTVKGIQSFLGSLNYYHQFVEHFAVYAAALYEVTQADLAKEALEPGHLASARHAFAELQRRLADAPVLKHFDGAKLPVVVIYANPWAIAATLVQEYDGKWMPIKFFSRVLKVHEIKFTPAEKEILALLHVLSAAANMLIGKPLKVLTRHSSLGWLFKAKGLQGRLERWMVTLSPWTLEVVRVERGEDGLTGLMAAAIGPADRTDEMLEAVQPRKRSGEERFRLPVPTLAPGASAWVVSFDGSAKPKRAGASCGAVLWSVPTWDIAAAETFYFEDGTVNEAEYKGAMAAMDLAIQRGIKDVIICGDSRIVIQQLRGDIECRTPGLQVLRAEALLKLSQFSSAHLLHVARDFNGAADLITGKALQRGAGGEVDAAEHDGMKLLNRLQEVLVEGEADNARAIHVTTRSGAGARIEIPASTTGDMGTADQDVINDSVENDDVRAGPMGTAAECRDGTDHSSGDDVHMDETSQVTDDERRRDETSQTHEARPDVHEPDHASDDDGGGEEDVQSPTDDSVEGWVDRLRAERVKIAQDEETWMNHLKRHLRGDIGALAAHEATACEKLANSYELVDELLYYVGWRAAKDRERWEWRLRLVVPTTLHQDVLRHYHTSLAGGHQGVTRVYERVRRLFFWRGMYADVRNYVAACPDCQSGKGQPRISVRSPGNLVATRPFEIIGMDHVPSLPKSARGNTELLIWIDHHTGFVIVSANKSREAQEVAESYERCVYRRFGASSVIRHD
jgi:ribonuclease HI